MGRNKMLGLPWARWCWGVPESHPAEHDKSDLIHSEFSEVCVSKWRREWVRVHVSEWLLKYQSEQISKKEADDEDKTGCSVETRLVLHMPSSSWAGKHYYYCDYYCYYHYYWWRHTSHAVAISQQETAYCRLCVQARHGRRASSMHQYWAAAASHVFRQGLSMVRGTPSASAVALSLAACWLKADKPSHEPTLLPATVRSISVYFLSSGCVSSFCTEPYSSAWQADMSAHCWFIWVDLGFWLFLKFCFSCQQTRGWQIRA